MTPCLSGEKETCGSPRGPGIENHVTDQTTQRVPSSVGERLEDIRTPFSRSLGRVHTPGRTKTDSGATTTVYRVRTGDPCLGKDIADRGKEEWRQTCRYVGGRSRYTGSRKSAVITSGVKGNNTQNDEFGVWREILSLLGNDESLPLSGFRVST